MARFRMFAGKASNLQPFHGQDDTFDQLWRQNALSKGDEEKRVIRCRLVGKEFANGKDDELFAGTPPLEALKALVCIMTKHVNDPKIAGDKEFVKKVLIKLQSVFGELKVSWRTSTNCGVQHIRDPAYPLGITP